MSALLHINDAELGFHNTLGSVTSPGYALAAETLLTGIAAQAQAKLKPNQCFDRFWQNLDQQPLQRPVGLARHHADLAWYHLQALWQSLCAQQPAPEQIVLAVPAAFGKDALEQLLGISQALSLPISGVVESSLLASRGSQAQNCLYLDATLHRLYASRCLQQDGQWQFDYTETLGRQGLSHMEKAWVQVVAEHFIEDSRFDPLHSAEGEQALYQQLPQWREQLSRDGQLRVDIDAEQGQRSADIEVSRLDAASAPMLSALAGAIQQWQSPSQNPNQNQNGEIRLSQRLAQWPGLEKAVQALAGEAAVQVISDAELARQAQKLNSEVSRTADALEWVTAVST